jgi:actin-related protein 8
LNLDDNAVTEEQKDPADKAKVTPEEPGSLENAADVIDIEEEAKFPSSSIQAASLTSGSKVSLASKAPASTYPGGFVIDVCFEASKLPLDVAIFNSARAAGGDEKIRKYLQAVLIIGGTALVPGMAHALESRRVVCGFRSHFYSC